MPAMYVMTVQGGIEPELYGPYREEETVRLVARYHHTHDDPESDAVFVLVSGHGGLEVQTYGTGITAGLGGDDEDAEEEAAPWPFCRICGKLAGPDYHLAGVVAPGENAVVCPACWDERLR